MSTDIKDPKKESATHGTQQQNPGQHDKNDPKKDQGNQSNNQGQQSGKPSMDRR
jgi:hypothetical protein